MSTYLLSNKGGALSLAQIDVDGVEAASMSALAQKLGLAAEPRSFIYLRPDSSLVLRVEDAVTPLPAKEVA